MENTKNISISVREYTAGKSETLKTSEWKKWAAAAGIIGILILLARLLMLLGVTIYLLNSHTDDSANCGAGEIQKCTCVPEMNITDYKNHNIYD